MAGQPVKPDQPCNSYKKRRCETPMNKPQPELLKGLQG